MAVDREELFGKLLWVQENLDSFDSASEWTERLGLAMLQARWADGHPGAV